MHLFVAITPYHLLLSYALALTIRGNTGKPVGLVVIAHFADAPKLAEWVAGTAGVFEEVRCIRGAYGIKNRYLRQLRYRITTSLLAGYLARLELDAVYVGNDACPESQLVLHLAKSRSPTAPTAYIEDGLAAYCDISAQPRVGPVARLGMKLLFGFHWNNVPVLGTSPWIDRVFALYPEYLRPELAGLDAYPIPRAPLEDGELARRAADYVAAAGLDAIDESSDCIIVSVSHSSTVNDRSAYRSEILRLLKTSYADSATIFLKYHPREPKGDFLGLTRDTRICEFPRGIPVELLYLARKGNIKLVVGDATTALVTARWLCPQAEVVSLAGKLSRRAPSGVLKFFHEIGIYCPSVTED